MRSLRVSALTYLAIGSVVGFCVFALHAWAQDPVSSDWDDATLTPAQQAIVDQITRRHPRPIKPDSGNVTGQKAVEGRHTRLVLPRAGEGEISFVSTRPLLSSERGITW